ncbi:helix-turn-helix transcriptional regulator [Litoribrevibacter albus]|uniref:Transcriptional regulator n=1 Tax=Litoribrevibacter albus TaxID=1473156 RepID=A0AA37S940_9GAMM|nr:WYL domain-containing transcriptional regulator [Litoribrevibacter albus]GLQ30362.1 transcriptional regulator [Litoribrevibacter albus]
MSDMDIGPMESRGEKLAPRLVEIIIKLASGQKFTTAKLAEEFGVDQRTIRRDLNERLSNYVERDSNNNYYITPSLLGKLTTSDFRGLANNAGIGGLYPELTNRFIKELLDQGSETVYDVEGYNYENNQEYRSLFQKLNSAIKEQQIIKFIYKEKNYSDIHPYQIKNANGIWYLMAVDGGKIKSFSISKIDCLIIHQSRFQKNEAFNKEIKEQDGVWISSQQIEVIVLVDSKVADYFKRRDLLPNQVIEQELKDGDLKVKSTVYHPNEIVPLIKYWMPHLRVVGPGSISKSVKLDIQRYLEE